ncbi:MULTISPECIES: HpcH/HpaI aldolase/citrate lyase family protein [unclassified Nocardioides]|uniref:HpcH/HpaI aldolase/citrate lyase family protein n=1 Tax=unclassified Nocardioides TaxID=2615069 RepID=UPI001E61D303|nr:MULTISPECIES: CoA ester lyase [unclassified Nocardioides]
MAEQASGQTALARSALYVPGDAPDKLRKALDRGADELIVDLEDAVLPANKPLARDLVATWLDSLPETDVRVWVRINPGAERELDVRAVAGCAGLAGLAVAKTESAQELVELDALLTSLGSDVRVVPLLESAHAIFQAREIAAAPRVQRIQIGEADLSADVGISAGPDERELLFARSHVVFASAAAGIAPPIAPVSVEFRDLDAFRASTEAAARLGFVGRACIHPAQVAVANEVFTPSAEQVEKATALLARFDGADAVGVDADGRFVDEAVLRQARLVLARAVTR